MYPHRGLHNTALAEQNGDKLGFEYQDAYIYYSWFVHGPTYERGV